MNGVSHAKVHYGIKGYSILDSAPRFPSKYKDIFERLLGMHFAIRLGGRMKNGKE
jgi:hypothetical protein